MSVGHCISTSVCRFPVDYKVQKRTSSVAISICGTASEFYIRDASGNSATGGTIGGEFYDCNANCSSSRTGSGLSAGNAAQVRSSGNLAGVQIDAEL